MDREAWHAAIHGLAKSWTWLSDWTELNWSEKSSRSAVKATDLQILMYEWWCGGLVTKSCLTLATPWTVACQAPLCMGFPRQEYWSGYSFPFPLLFNTTMLFCYSSPKGLRYKARNSLSLRWELMTMGPRGFAVWIHTLCRRNAHHSKMVESIVISTKVPEFKPSSA